jgi:hypothetical protein
MSPLTVHVIAVAGTAEWGDGTSECSMDGMKRLKIGLGLFSVDRDGEVIWRRFRLLWKDWREVNRKPQRWRGEGLPSSYLCSRRAEMILGGALLESRNVVADDKIRATSTHRRPLQCEALPKSDMLSSGRTQEINSRLRRQQCRKS